MAGQVRKIENPEALPKKNTFRELLSKILFQVS